MSAGKMFLPAAASEMAARDWPEVRHLVEDVGGIAVASQALGVTRQSLSAWLSGDGPADVVKVGVISVLRFALVSAKGYWSDRQDATEEQIAA